MQVQVASFSTIKVNKSYYVHVDGVRRDLENLYFQVDTGASISLIGLNTICDEDSTRKNVLKTVIRKEVGTYGIIPFKERPRTVTGEQVEVFPCKLNGVSVMGTNPFTFFFCVYWGNISVPLLGYDYLDDCTYHHVAGGVVEILGVTEHPGRRFYSDNILDFNKVLDKYYSEI